MIKITDTTFRDAHQSHLATRLKTKDLLKIAEKMDEVGFFSCEMWGGATFDSCLRFLKENPWDRIKLLKQKMRKTPFQMLLRGQNIVGYKHYPDDVLESFIKQASKCGIDIFRIFDALNDVRNMERSIEYVLSEKKHAQGAICYTISPVHSIKKYLEMAKDLEKLGCQSLCIKDMAGLLDPNTSFKLIKALKRKLEIPIQLHSHCTSGMASVSYLKAVEAGVDVLDTAISTMALGTSQPPTETIVSMLEGTKFDTGLDLELLSEIAEYFREVRKRYKDYETKLMGVDTNVLKFQIPGGMYSNLEAQLKAQNAFHRIQEVLAEVPKVRRDLGYPPLVTPSSQIVGTQATLNVLMGERYKAVPKEVKAYVRGLYGRPPAKIDEKVRKKIIGDEDEIECRPADLLEPQLERLREKLKTEDVEKLLCYALFPAVSKVFFEEKGGIAKETLVAIACALYKRESKVPPRKEKLRSPWLVASRLEGIG